jgi:hypothetical protein
MFTQTKIVLGLCVVTGLLLGGLSLLDASPTQQAALAPDRDIVGSYLDSRGDEHVTIMVNGGWSYVDFVIYRSFELVPVLDDKGMEVRIFSGGKRIATTNLFAGEELAMIEAKKIVDGIRRP